MYKNDRTAEDIRREITAIIRELKDPRVQGKLLTVVRIELANDLSFGKVYISALEGYETAVNAVSGFAGLAPSIACAKGGKRIAMSNKEAIVTAYKFLKKEKFTEIQILIKLKKNLKKEKKLI